MFINLMKSRVQQLLSYPDMNCFLFCFLSLEGIKNKKKAQCSVHLIPRKASSQSLISCYLMGSSPDVFVPSIGPNGESIDKARN